MLRLLKSVALALLLNGCAPAEEAWVADPANPSSCPSWKEAAYNTERADAGWCSEGVTCKWSLTDESGFALCRCEGAVRCTTYQVR